MLDSGKGRVPVCVQIWCWCRRIQVASFSCYFPPFFSFGFWVSLHCPISCNGYCPSSRFRQLGLLLKFVFTIQLEFQSRNRPFQILISLRWWGQGKKLYRRCLNNKISCWVVEQRMEMRLTLSPWAPLFKDFKSEIQNLSEGLHREMRSTSVICVIPIWWVVEAEVSWVVEWGGKYFIRARSFMSICLNMERTLEKELNSKREGLMDTE